MGQDLWMSTPKENPFLAPNSESDDLTHTKPDVILRLSFQDWSPSWFPDEDPYEPSSSVSILQLEYRNLTELGQCLVFPSIFNLRSLLVADDVLPFLCESVELYQCQRIQRRVLEILCFASRYAPLHTTQVWQHKWISVFSACTEHAPA